MVDPTNITFLEQSAAAQKQQVLHQWAYQGLNQWALAARLPVRTIKARELALLFWLYEALLDGELVHQAQKLVATIAASRVDMVGRTTLPLVFRSP